MAWCNICEKSHKIKTHTGNNIGYTQQDNRSITKTLLPEEDSLLTIDGNGTVRVLPDKVSVFFFIYI